MRLFDYRVKRKRHYHTASSGHHHHHHHRHHSGYGRRRRGSGTALKVFGIIAAVFVLLIAGGFGAFTYLRAAGKKSLAARAGTQGPDLGALQEESGLVSRNGKKYRYNEDMINILCMGIDKDTDLSDESESAASGENGQADTIFVLALNLKNNTMKLLGISRDTMTEIRTYDYQGNYVGETKNHLGLAYAFGDGREESGELMTEAVSKLLYGLPFHGYAAVNYNAIAKLNDSVGGVTVTMPEEMILNGERFPSGKTVHLSGAQAHSFVRNRDTEKEGSNNLRMERQRQYALAFVQEAKSALTRNVTLVADLYQDLTEDMVTSIGVDEAVYLASLLPGISFHIEDIQMLAGTTKQGSVYEEFYADEEALLDTLLDLFYVEVG